MTKLAVSEKFQKLLPPKTVDFPSFSSWSLSIQFTNIDVNWNDAVLFL